MLAPYVKQLSLSDKTHVSNSFIGLVLSLVFSFLFILNNQHTLKEKKRKHKIKHKHTNQSDSIKGQKKDEFEKDQAEA